MPHIKVTKSNAYFSRFQVKRRRRREGKTDYQARTAMVTQDCNKYGAKKYRFVVRFTNQRVICQVIYATIQGDCTVASADSFELKPYGITTGLKNYAAAYATGLLCARRVLKKMNQDTQFVGIENATGEEYHIEEEFGESRPFKCILDVGLVHTSTGNRVFGALKGAVDGGIHIPHSTKRFPGFDSESGEYDAEVHRARIFGLHVGDYMKQMEETEPEKFKSHFSKFIIAGVNGDNIEEIYSKAHAAIRANPDPKPAAQYVVRREGDYILVNDKKVLKPKKLSCEQRKQRVAAKLVKIMELTQ